MESVHFHPLVWEQAVQQVLQAGYQPLLPERSVRVQREHWRTPGLLPEQLGFPRGLSQVQRFLQVLGPQQFFLPPVFPALSFPAYAPEFPLHEETSPHYLPLKLLTHYSGERLH